MHTAPMCWLSCNHAYEAPSLYDECLRLFKRRGLNAPDSHTQRDWRQP